MIHLQSCLVSFFLSLWWRYLQKDPKVVLLAVAGFIQSTLFQRTPRAGPFIWQGRNQDFSKGGGGGVGLSRCSPLCISGLSRIILTKDKSRWRKYFTKKETLKKWAFQQWLLRPRYFHGVFATCIEYCRWRPTKEGGGGSRAPQDPPSLATPLNRGASRRERGGPHILTWKPLVYNMCIFSFGRVPKETSRNFCIRASVRFFRHGPEKRLRASDFPVKMTIKNPF